MGLKHFTLLDIRNVMKSDIINAFMVQDIIEEAKGELVYEQPFVLILHETMGGNLVPKEIILMVH